MQFEWSSGSILHQNVADCSCLYPLVASGSFGSCLPGSRHIMPISALLMFVPGGRPFRRLGLSRLSADSQRIS